MAAIRAYAVDCSAFIRVVSDTDDFDCAGAFADLVGSRAQLARLCAPLGLNPRHIGNQIEARLNASVVIKMGGLN